MSISGYNGWSNRETWAANLWITNDEGLHLAANEAMNDAIAHDGDGMRQENSQPVSARDIHVAATALHDWWSELTDPEEGLMDCRDILTMVRDIGQEDAINWEEIAASLLAE